MRYLPSIVRRRIKNPEYVASSIENQVESMPERSETMSKDLRSPQISVSEDCDTRELEDVMGLMSLVRKRIQLKKSYFQLIALCCFFCVFAASITMQRNTFSAFRIHSSAFMSKIMTTLPTNGAGSWIGNGALPLANGMLDVEDIYTWLGDVILPSVFQDAVCGDGVCDELQEERGIGEFGCLEDCGPVAKEDTVSLVVELSTIMQSRFKSKFDLGDSDPGFRYNIWRCAPSAVTAARFAPSVPLALAASSYTLLLEPSFLARPSAAATHALRGSASRQAYIFREHQNKSYLKVPVNKDDDLTLHLFQTWSFAYSMDVDETDVEDLTGILATSVPARNAATAFAYGDPREMLLAAVHQARQWVEFCRNPQTVGDVELGGPSDDNCRDSNYVGSDIVAALQLLNSYGIQGDISVRRRVPSWAIEGKTAMKSVSLLRNCTLDEPGCRPGVAFCSIGRPDSPVGLLGFRLTTDELVARIFAASVACESAARRARSPGPGASSGDHVLALMQQKAEGPALVTGAFALREEAPAASSPAFVTLGQPNGECWYCRVRNGSDCSGDTAAGGAIISAVGCAWIRTGGFSGMTTAEVAMVTVPEYDGPLFAVFDVASPRPGDLRYTTDGSAPSCEGDGRLPPAMAVVRHGGGSRVVLSPAFLSRGAGSGPVSFTALKAKACGSNASEVHTLDLAALPPLVRGPTVELTLSLKEALDAARLLDFRQQLCKRLWPATYFDDEEARCSYQLFTEMQEVGGVWKLKLTVLMQSNGHATRARLFINEKVRASGFSAAFGILDALPIAAVIAPGPKVKLTQSASYGCATHEDCADGLFCSANKLMPKGFRGFFGCDPCPFCMRDEDSADGACPKDRCALTVGMYPRCINARALLGDLHCPSTFELNMSRIRSASTDMDSSQSRRRALLALKFVGGGSGGGGGGTSGSQGSAASSSSGDVANKQYRNASKSVSRFLTPFNRLVGAIMISQKRVETADCRLTNKYIQNYSDFGSGLDCLGDSLDPTPFGRDPVFTTTSTLYSGDLAVDNYYEVSERAPDLDGELSSPFGFFPHNYDTYFDKNSSILGNNLSSKDKTIIVPERANEFLLYFDERLNYQQADRMLIYMKDGGFIDVQTRKISVEMNTLNLEYGLFSTFIFTFHFQEEGIVTWNFEIHSVPADLYSYSESSVQIFLEVFCVIMLAINSALETIDLLEAIRRFQILDYLLDPWNTIDWLHMTLMWISLSLWVYQYHESVSFTMMPRYEILENTGARARFFKTQAEKEFEFLQFSSNLRKLSENLDRYISISSICVLLFILRLLKAMHFQPKMALITRTMGNALGDLFHFLILGCIILGGYACAGHLLFGQLHEGFSSFQNSIVTLFFSLVALNPESLFTHLSTTSWTFHVFFWTWLCLAFFVMLNILLAILVEGFMGVKKNNEAVQDSMISELLEISMHEMQRALKLLSRTYVFLSDEDILTKLEGRLERLALRSVARRRALHDYALITLSSNCMAVPLQSGVLLDRARLNSLLFAEVPSQAAAQQHQRSIPSDNGELPQQLKPSSSTRARGEMYLNPALTDVMQRYGCVGSPDLAGAPHALRSCESEPMQLREESLSRQLARGRVWTLAIQVVCARHLPRMDLFRGADVFCGVFLEGFPGIVYQTEIRRGRSDADWRWEDEGAYTWELGGDAAVNSAIAAGRAAVVMLYDKDQLSSDDVVGCAALSLRSLRDSGGSFDGWVDIQRRAAPPPSSLVRRIVAKFIHVFGTATAMAHVQPQIHLRATLLDVDALPMPALHGNGHPSPAQEGVAGDAVCRSSRLPDPDASTSSGYVESAEGLIFSSGDRLIDVAEPIIAGSRSADFNSVRYVVGGEISVYTSQELEKIDALPSVELPMVDLSPIGNTPSCFHSNGGQ